MVRKQLLTLKAERRRKVLQRRGHSAPSTNKPLEASLQSSGRDDSQTVEEELESPAAVFVKTELVYESEEEIQNDEPLQEAEVFQDEENMQDKPPQENEVFQYEEESIHDKPLQETEVFQDEKGCMHDKPLQGTEVFQDEEERILQENEANEDEEEMVLGPPFLEPAENNEVFGAVKIKEEPLDDIEVHSWDNEEELEFPATVFVKTETECEGEEQLQNKEDSSNDTFQEDKASQDEGEETLESPATVFVKTEALCEIEETFQVEEGSWNEEAFQRHEATQDKKEDPPPPSSESVFLASIKQKIGALFPGGGTSKSPTAGKPYVDFVCVCGIRFGTEEAAAVHSTLHNEAKPFRCPICSEHFATMEVVVPHITNHLEGKSSQYSIYKKNSKQLNPLHLLKLTGKRNFQCYVCNKNFREKDYLIAHMRAHTGGRPYQCEICDKLFWEKSFFYTHMRKHTGEKPFQCNVCNKCFTQRGALTQHIRIHTGEKPYQCDVCEKRFTQLSGLNAHMLTHTGKKKRKKTFF